MGNKKLDIGATFQTEAPGPQIAPFELTIQYKTPEENGHWKYDGAPTGTEIEFTTLEHDGTEGRAIGSFKGTLCYAANYESNVDAGNCRPIEGSFDTRFFVE